MRGARTEHIVPLGTSKQLLPFPHGILCPPAPLAQRRQELALVSEGGTARKGLEEVEGERGEGLEGRRRVGRDEGEQS
jgi:hypothetical protein